MDMLPGISETGRDALGYLGGGILALSLVPQITKLILTRSAADISLAWSILYMLGTGLSFVYLVLLGALAAWIPVAFELIGCVVTISLKLLYDYTAWGRNQQLLLQEEQFRIWQQQYVESLKLAALQEEDGHVTCRESTPIETQAAYGNAADEPMAAAYVTASPSKRRLGLAAAAVAAVAAADPGGINVQLTEPACQMHQSLAQGAFPPHGHSKQHESICRCPKEQQLEAASTDVSADGAGAAAASTQSSTNNSASGSSTVGSSKYTRNFHVPGFGLPATAAAAMLSGSGLAAMHLGQLGKVSFEAKRLPWYSQTGISHAAALPMQVSMHCCHVCGAAQLCNRNSRSSQPGSVIHAVSSFGRMVGNVVSGVTSAAGGSSTKPPSRELAAARRWSLDMPNLQAGAANPVPAAAPAAAAAAASGAGESAVRPSPSVRRHQIAGSSIKRVWHNMLFSVNGGDHKQADSETALPVQRCSTSDGVQCQGVSVHEAAAAAPEGAAAGAKATGCRAAPAQDAETGSDMYRYRYRYSSDLAAVPSGNQQPGSSSSSSSSSSSVSGVSRIWNNVLFSLSGAGRVKAPGAAATTGAGASRRVTLDMPHLEDEATNEPPTGAAAAAAAAMATTAAAMAAASAAASTENGATATCSYTGGSGRSGHAGPTTSDGDLPSPAVAGRSMSGSLEHVTAGRELVGMTAADGGEGRSAVRAPHRLSHCYD